MKIAIDSKIGRTLTVTVIGQDRKEAYLTVQTVGGEKIDVALLPDVLDDLIDALEKARCEIEPEPK